MKTTPFYFVFKSDFSLYCMESKQACKFVGMIKVGLLEDEWLVKEYEVRCKSSLFYDRNATLS